MPADSDESVAWFLRQGLPAVVSPRDLSRHFLSRAAPALTALAVVAVNSILVVAVLGQHVVDIRGRPDALQSVALVLLAITLPAAAVVGWLISRIESRYRRLLVCGIAVAAIVLGALFGGPARHTSVNLMIFGVAVGMILVLTATGVGAILAWTARMTLSNLALVAGMFVRALPVVLLTFLVFFNGNVWQMTPLISRGRLWLGIAFLLLLASSFLVSSALEDVRQLAAEPKESLGARLAGTPFEQAADSPATPLRRCERFNVILVVAISQIVHVLTIAAMTALVFIVLGLILLSPEVLSAWTRDQGRPDGELLTMTIPIPNSLIQTVLLLAAITFMYLAAKAVTDVQYRSRFLDPLLDELRLSLAALGRFQSTQRLA